MRAKEFLYEDYNQRLQSDLENLLVGTKASGSADISTQDLADQMQAMGYSVSPESLIPLLQNNPSVLNASADSIRLNTDNGEAAPGDESEDQDSAAQVQNMAQKATDKASSIG